MKRLTKYDNSAKCYLPFNLVNWDEIKIMNKLGELEDILEKYGIENAEELDDFIKNKDCQINRLKQNYENCSKLEKIISKERQYCLDNWRACEKELAELRQKAIVPKEDKFVIVSNAWKHNKKYGIAKVKQIMSDHYILQTDDYLGTYVPCIQFGGFKTLEEAEQKLAEIKGDKDE